MFMGFCEQFIGAYSFLCYLAFLQLLDEGMGEKETGSGKFTALTHVAHNATAQP